MFSKIFTLVLVNAMIGNVYTQYSVLINLNERVCAYNSFIFIDTKHIVTTISKKAKEQA